VPNPTGSHPRSRRCPARRRGSSHSRCGTWHRTRRAEPCPVGRLTSGAPGRLRHWAPAACPPQRRHPRPAVAADALPSSRLAVAASVPAHTGDGRDLHASDRTARTPRANRRQSTTTGVVTETRSRTRCAGSHSSS
jgi:hypothetical protein